MTLEKGIKKTMDSYIKVTDSIKKLRREKKQGYESLVEAYSWSINLSAFLIKDFQNKNEKLFEKVLEESGLSDRLEQAIKYNLSYLEKGYPEKKVVN